MRTVQSIGKLGENIAGRYLQRKGYTILETNFQNTKGYKYGEIDIVTRKGDALVFIEVKTRIVRNDDEVFPEENISPTKLRNLEKIAETFIRKHGLWDVSYGFDAVAIMLDPSLKKARVKHLENIFL